MVRPYQSAPAGWALRAALLSSVTFFPLSGWAQDQAVDQPGQAGAVQVLLDQAAYWHRQSDSARADYALRRALLLEPSNPDVLASEAQAEAERGDRTAARKTLTRLAAARSDDPRIAIILQGLQVGPLDAAALGEARGLAASGKAGQAVIAYQRAFKGESPPPSVAVEYYQTLLSTEAGYAAGRTGLETFVRVNPENLQAQLAYGQALIYREGTRADGVDRLAALTQASSVAEPARVSWRDGLLWSGSDLRAQRQLAEYLRQYPADAQLDQRRTEIAASLPDAATQSRLRGYEAISAHRLADAEREFKQATVNNANDVESFVMLASIRRAQRREADVSRFLARAGQIDPERAAELIASVGLDRVYSAKIGSSHRDEGGHVRRQYERVTELTRRGEFAAAETLLRHLMGSHPSDGAALRLADLEAKAGQLPEAENSYRSELRHSPRNANALAGLAAVLTREGKVDEAQTVWSRADLSSLPAGTGQARAQSLRQQARAASEPATRELLYRQAISADPSDPWLRLELSRSFAADGKAAEAAQVMTGVADGARPSNDQLRAGIYFAESVKDYTQVARLAARLPANLRTPQLLQSQMHAEAAVELEEARAQGSPPATRQRLLALAARPDQTGGRVAVFAQELLRTGDKSGAREVINAAIKSSQSLTPEQRLAYSAALIGAGFPHDAQVLTDGLQPDRLPPVQRGQLAALKDGAAVVAADALNGRGRQADAYDILAPRLAHDPDNADLNLALARLYAAHAQPRQAVAITEEVLQRNPNSLDAQVGAINAAVQAGQIARAMELAAHAKERFPAEPQAFVAAAAAERASGLNGSALADLRTARALRARQLSTSSSDAADVLLPMWLPGRRYAANLPPNTMSDAVDDAPWEPVTREYERYADTSAAAAVADPHRDMSGGLPNDPVRGAPVLQKQMAQNGDGRLDVPTGVNPFRSGAGLTPDEPARAPLIPPDPLTSDIERSIREVSDDIAPRFEASLSVRGRSGQGGLAQLLDVETPLEASFSPGGVGRLRAVLTPTSLFAGSAGSDGRRFFGTNPLRQGTGAALGAGSGSAYGAGLDISYSYGPLTADIGSTPLGFRRENVVGGVEYLQRLNDGLNLRLLGERRAVTDSVLSFAGERDPRTGEDWGGVTRTRGHAQIEGSLGQVSYYAGAGAAALQGEQVRQNSEVEAGAGFSIPLYKTPTQEARAGLDLVYFAYDRNLNGFTLGNGGYFSPQQFFAALIPVTYSEQVTPDLSYKLGISFGAQTFRSKGEDIFPTNPALQGQLNALATGNATVAARLGGSRDTGPAGGARGEIDYRVRGNFHVGAKAGFDRSGNYTEGSGLIYARYTFDGGL